MDKLTIPLKGIKHLKYRTRVNPAYMLQLIFIFMSINCYSAYAGTISIIQTSTASINGNVLTVELNITNEGNSPAFNVVPRVIMAGKNILLPGIANLFPGKSYKQSASSSLGDNSAGEFHIISIIDYRDEQGQRNNNTNKLYLNTAPIEQHPINISLTTESSDRLESRHIVQLKNESRENIDITLQIVAPDGIAINQISKKFSLDGLAKTSIPIILSSTNLLQYKESPLHAIIYYTHNSLNLSQTASTAVNLQVKQPVLKSFFSSEKITLGLGGIFLGALILVIMRNIRMRLKKN